MERENSKKHYRKLEMEDQLIYTTSMGDPVIRRDESIIIQFTGKRNVVSTSNLNGGYREDLEYAFNNSCGKNPLIKQRICPGMKGKTIEEHYAVIAQENNLIPNLTTGMGTAALMENVAIVSKSYDKLTVTAIATGGIDVNGGSAGDLARHNEFTKQPINVPGTINIFLLIDAKLLPGVLTRALMTATEAKSVALRELAAPSMYSEEPATGSGTDSLIAIGNLDAEIELHGAGKHCILGQLIGQSVKEAVQKALDKQCGMNPQRQASIIWQGKRYGICNENLYSQYEKIGAEKKFSFEDFSCKIQPITTNNENVGYVVSLFHLIDQHRWGMLTNETLNIIGLPLLNAFRKANNLTKLNTETKFTSYQEIITEIEKIIIECITKLI